jgi:hypothetical protein
MRWIIAIVLLTGLTGCGPLFVPMLPKLDPEDQRKVDAMWDNVLTPVQRVNRETLLDANVAYWMYAIGVDRMHMTSEKHFSGGTAVMEIDCNRANPDTDQFTITVQDERGRTVRRERYSRAEVEESARMLRGISNVGPTELRAMKPQWHATIQVTQPTTGPATQPGTGPSTEPATQPEQNSVARIEETPQERQFRLESERRRTAAEAATQPARLSTHDSSGR